MATNCLFVYQIKSKSKLLGKLSRKNENLSISVLVLTVSLLFIVFTVPNTVASSFFVKQLFESRDGITFIFYLDTLLFSFHGFSFFALFFSNKQFSSEAKSFLCLKKKNRIMCASTTVTKSAPIAVPIKIK